MPGLCRNKIPRLSGSAGIYCLLHTSRNLSAFRASYFYPDYEESKDEAYSVDLILVESMIMINLKVTQLYRWKSYYEESNLFANVPGMYINLFFLSPYYASLAASPLGNSVITAIFHYSSNSAAHGGRWSLCGMFKHHSVLSWIGRTKQEKMWHRVLEHEHTDLTLFVKGGSYFLRTWHLVWSVFPLWKSELRLRGRLTLENE